jgi:hypothetical protein
MAEIGILGRLLIALAILPETSANASCRTMTNVWGTLEKIPRLVELSGIPTEVGCMTKAAM